MPCGQCPRACRRTAGVPVLWVLAAAVTSGITIHRIVMPDRYLRTIARERPVLPGMCAELDECLFMRVRERCRIAGADAGCRRLHPRKSRKPSVVARRRL